MDEERIPALRHVDMIPVTRSGQDLLLLRDPQGVASEPILMSIASLQLLRLFDGNHSVRDVQAAIARTSGQIIPSDQIRSFVEKLDEHFYLDSLTCLERRRELTLEYSSWQVRPPQFAGQAYSKDADRLNAELDGFYLHPQGPGLPEEKTSQLPAGIAAPHIDPPRGGAVYARAYRHLWGADPQKVIVLGIAHAGASQPFVLTSKDFATPLGTAQTDRVLLGDLAGQLDWDPLEEEALHRWEHSIEFQILFTQHALTCGGRRSLRRPPQYLPILCAFGWETFLEEDSTAAARSQIIGFLQTLGTLLTETAETFVVIAGIDLAHMGRRFGDPLTLSDAFLSGIRNRDLATLDLLAEGEREAFMEETVRERDERRICGFSALYSLLTLLRGVSGRVVGYDQSVDTEQGGIVSFPALVYDRA